jgi:hypothetical protein
MYMAKSDKKLKDCNVSIYRLRFPEESGSESIKDQNNKWIYLKFYIFN